MRVSYQKHISLSCLVTGPTNPPLWPVFLFAFARFLFDHCLVTSLLSFHMWLNLSLPSIALVALPPLPGQTLGGHLQPPCLIWFHPGMGWMLRETSLLIAEVCLPGHVWSALASQLCLPAQTDLYPLMDFAVSGLAAP